MTARNRHHVGRLRRLLAVATVLCGFTLTLGAASDASATPNVAQQLQAVLAAAKHAGSVRISVQFFSGKTAGRSMQDSALNSGQITVAIGSQRVSIVLRGGVGYIFANSAGVSGYLGFSQQLSNALANKWISVQPSDAGFSGYVANISLNSALVTVTPTGTLVAGKKTKVSGKTVQTIEGSGPGGNGRTSVFYAAKGRPLPVEVVETAGSGSSEAGEIISFSRWGEKVNLAKPTKPLPMAQIQAALSGS